LQLLLYRPLAQGIVTDVHPTQKIDLTKGTFFIHFCHFVLVCHKMNEQSLGPHCNECWYWV